MMPPDLERPREEPPNEKRPPGHEGARLELPTTSNEADAPIVPEEGVGGKEELGSTKGPTRPLSGSKWEVNLPDPVANEALRQYLLHESDMTIAKAVEVIGKASPWPAPKTMPANMQPGAYYGLAGKIVRGIEQQTEAHPAAILLQLLCGLGTLIGPTPFHAVGPDRHRAQFYVALVGQSALARKGTSFSIVRLLLREVDAAWTDSCIVGGIKSGEAMIDAVRDASEDGEKPAASDKRKLFHEPEFAQVLKVMRREGNTLSTAIRTLWDGNVTHSISLSTPLRATGAHVAIVGHVTKRELSKLLGDTEALNGFANRFLWCQTRRVRSIPKTGLLDLDGVRDELAELGRVVELARARDEVPMSPEADQAWEAIYHDMTDEDESVAATIAARGTAYVLRLALLFALLDESKCIEPSHLNAARAVWDYCEASVDSIWGDSKGSALADRIWRAVQQQPRGLTRTDLQTSLNRKKSKDEIDRAIKQLLGRGLLTIETRPTAGRPAEIYHPNYLEDDRPPSDTHAAQPEEEV